jgi:hypothetical protein
MNADEQVTSGLKTIELESLSRMRPLMYLVFSLSKSDVVAWSRGGTSFSFKGNESSIISLIEFMLFSAMTGAGLFKHSNSFT